jgi:hypothetical protein
VLWPNGRFSLFSYAEHVNFALLADGHIPNAPAIAAHFLSEFNTLKELQCA